MQRILLVDDDDPVREEAGYAVVPATNGDEGLAALGRETFDLVILDILMPEREGIETIREIRKASKMLPIIAMSVGDKTGWSDFLRMASALGANDTIGKPFTGTELVKRVRRLLGAPPSAA